MNKIFYWILFGGALVGLCCKAGPSPDASEPPNVLFIAIDDLNDWLSCLGGHPDIKTPNIDQLAKEGILFTNAHCQAPICGPSRASIMTGLLPSTSGIYGQIGDERIDSAIGDRASFEYLPTYFSGHGYKTMGKGKLFHHFAPEGVFEVAGGREGGFGPKPPKRFKYDPAWFDDKEGGTQTDWGVFPERDEEMIDYQTAEWALQQLGQAHDRPFFMAVGFIRPHVPFYTPAKWFDMFDPDTISMPPYLPEDLNDVPEISLAVHEVPMMPTTKWAIESGEWKYAIQAYLACISFVDAQVGKVLQALRESDHHKNTIVVLWSDHGYHLGEKNRFAKHSLWEESTNVPLIFSYPNGLQGSQCRKPVQLLDIYPTLLDLCGLPPNVHNEGHSLRPLLEDPTSEWNHMAITTYGRSNHAVRSEHRRYIQYEDGTEELYDHRADPNEWENIASEPLNKSVVAEMKKHLPGVNREEAPGSRNNANRYFRGE